MYFKSNRNEQFRTFKFEVMIALVLPLLLFGSSISTTCEAAGGVDRIITKGMAIAKEHAEAQGWPANVLDLVNDPLRTDGWQAWFSGHNHFPEHFEFSPKTHQQVQHLIDRFGAIMSEETRIRFVEEKEPKSIGSIPVKRNILEMLKQRDTIGPVGDIYAGKGTTAVLSIGTQKAIELIRRSDLPETDKQRYFQYPTLTIYAGNDFIKRSDLEIPEHVKVIGDKGIEDEQAAEQDAISPIRSCDPGTHRPVDKLRARYHTPFQLPMVIDAQDAENIADFASGMSLVAAADKVSDLKERDERLEAACKCFQKFLKENAKHRLSRSVNVELARAQLQRGQILTTRARALDDSNLVEFEQRQALRIEARALLLETHQQTTSLAEELTAKLDQGPKVDRDRLQLIELRNEYFNVRMLSSISLEELAATYDVESPHRIKSLTLAAEQFHDLFTVYRIRLAGHYSRLYEARCCEKLRQHEKAAAICSELLGLPRDNPRFADVRREAAMLAELCRKKADE